MAAKPPPGLSMLDELKWKQQQKSAGGAPAGGDKKPGDKPASPAAPTNNGKPPPPPGRKTQAPSNPPKTEEANKGDAKSSPGAPKVNSLASRQAMLANIIGGGGGGGGGAPPKKDTPAPKKDGPPPAKKWGKVDTDGGGGGGGEAKLGAAAVKLEKPTDLSKYEKMAKMLPQGAVENAMVRDGFDPGYLFENCVTMKSDKKPIKAGGGDALAAPAAPATPVAPATAAPAAAAPAALVAPAGYAQSQAAAVPQAPYGVPPPVAPYGAPAAVPGYDPNQYYQQQQQGSAYPPPPGLAFPQTPQYSAPMSAYPTTPANNGWVQTWSPEYNSYYYLNTFTNQYSWEPPPGFQAQPAAFAAMPGVSGQGRIVTYVCFSLESITGTRRN